VVPYPQAGEKVTAFEERLDAQLGADSGGAARGPSRPRKESVVATPVERTFDLKIVGQAIQIPFELWALSEGVPQLKISDEEADIMAGPAKELLDHYLPEIPVIAWAWISLSIGLYATMRPRLELIQVLKTEKANTFHSAKRPAAPSPADVKAPKPGAAASSVYPSEITPERIP